MQALQFLVGLHAFSILFLFILHLILRVTENSLHTKREDRLRMYENGMLRRISVSEREELTGSWRKLYNAQLLYL
jgi:hypothetical protein